MKLPVGSFAAVLAVCAVLSVSAETRRVFRPELLACADADIRIRQPIDTASWIWHPSVDGDEAVQNAWGGGAGSFRTGWNGPRFLRFRCAFDHAGTAPLRFDVSADERFVLFLDGVLIARGPNRGCVARWTYQSYESDVTPGAHLLEAVVWRVGPSAPIAQLTWRGGFILKADGADDAQLTTGKGAWTVAEVKGIRPLRHDKFIGDDYETAGTGFLDPAAAPGPFVKALTVREGLKVDNRWGGSNPGWRLYPSVLPDQIERFVRPGAVRAVGPGGERHAVYQAADAGRAEIASFNALLKDGKSVTIPSNTALRVLWDLDDYFCGYPELTVSGGKGAEVFWAWTESLVDEKGIKGDRNAFVGKHRTENGFWYQVADVFRADGRAAASFSTPWWRCGRWCEIVIKTAAEPLTVTRLGLMESRYPLDRESSFVCDDPSLDGVQKICLRGMQMCSHEMLFDCPFYEQQMYPGDTRVQLLTIGSLTRDDRLIRRAIELYDFSRREDGLVGFNFPTRGIQDGATYTLCYALMYKDYLMRHEDAAWLRARLPGFHSTMFGLSAYENADGFLENLSGWSFMDWVPAWNNGVAPDGGYGQGVSALNNLLYVLALQSAAATDDALGETALAAYWRAKADALGKKIVAKFWDEKRGLVADTVKKNLFSEHAQCLALLAGILPPAKADRAFKGLLEAPDLARTTVYFSHYLFDVYGSHGRGDLILKRLDLWRDYVKTGLRTPLESPGDTARSDCHAWGSHPLYHLQADIAGIAPAEPFYKSVRVAPCPGGLKKIACRAPHPKGFVEVDLSFEEGKVLGTVTLPAGVPGTFVWAGKTIPLNPGVNRLQ